MPSILLIEDDPDMADAVQGMLRALGHEVTFAENGQVALQRIRAGFRPGLVLTDIVMPELDGIEVVQILGAQLTDTPIVAMSALKDTPYLRTAQLLGASEILAKPFTLQQLHQALDRALS